MPGLVKGLGDGTYGQLGTNPAGAPATVAGLSGVTEVAAGGFSTLALKSDGTVWFLGETTLQHTTPHGTPSPVSTPVQVAGPGRHRCHRRRPPPLPRARCGHRQPLRVGTQRQRPGRQRRPAGCHHPGRGPHRRGLDGRRRRVLARGEDRPTRSGPGDATPTANSASATPPTGSAPTQVPGVTTAAAVAAGGQHALILLTGGSVLATGNNDFGQLGLGTTTSTSTPTAVPGLERHHRDLRPAIPTPPRSVPAARSRSGVATSKASAAAEPARRSPTRPRKSLAGLSGTPTGIDCGYHFTLVELADGSIGAPAAIPTASSTAARWRIRTTARRSSHRS